MRRFFHTHIGCTAEILLCTAGSLQTIVGEITELAENAVILNMQGSTAACRIDNIAFVKMLQPLEPGSAEISFDSTHLQAPQNTSCAPQQSQQIMHPSQNAMQKAAQTIVRK